MTNLSVIICVYNGGKLFKKNIESASRLKIPDNTRIEFLFVDNNSTDGSGEIIKEYARKYPDTFHYLFEPKPGKSYALNLGIREAGGEILAFTDADTILPEDWLLRIKEGFAKHECAVLSGRVLPVWETKPPPWLLKDLNTGKGGPLALSISEKSGYYSRTGPAGVQNAVRKECFQKYGGFRTDLGIKAGVRFGVEDTEFFERLIRGGEKLFYYPPMTVYHQIPKSRMNQKYLFQEQFFTVLGGFRAKTRPISIAVVLKSFPKYIFKIVLCGVIPARLSKRSAIRYKTKFHSLLYAACYKYMGEKNLIRLAKVFRMIDEKQKSELLNF